MDVITILPALIALAVCVLGSPSLAFLNVYLPVLLMMPDHYRWRVPGLPDPTFQTAAILPIALILPFARRAAWRFSLMDLLVLAYASVIAYSEYRAEGYWDAQNLMLDQVCTVLLPYCLAKILVQPEGLADRLAKRFTVMLAVVAVLSLWEFRMGRRLFFESLWGYFYPGWPEIPVQYRWGFGRIGGPYTHAILAGMIFAVALLLQTWLMKGRHWKSRLTGRLVLAGILMGALLSMSRGPWVGMVLGGCVVLFAWVRDRKGLALKAGLLALIILPPAYEYLTQYTSVSSLRAGSLEQQNAAYRAELIDIYMPKVMLHPEFGWGSHRWPVDAGHPSIDNHYLLLALQHGITAVVLMVALILWVCLRLARYGGSQPPRSDSGALAFTLCGTIVSIGIAIGTAFLGAQVEPVLFLLLGWSEGLILYGYGSRRGAPSPAAEQVAGRLHSFQRVMT